MLVYDKYIFGSQREIDENGYLRVGICNITKAQVRPYYGREIPNYDLMGLDSNTIYGVLCPAEELQSAASTFNNIPLCRKHIKVDVENVPSKDIVGSLGDNCVFESPYLKNSLIVYDKKEIDLIMSGKKKELSCGYTYEPVKESGEFDGVHYDVKMTNIVGNHIALVKQGRAGRDVMVADTLKELKDGLLNSLKEKVMAVFDNEIPDEQEQSQDAGEETALQQGEQEMAEQVKEEAKVEEPVQEVVADAEPAPAEEQKAEEKPVEDAQPAEAPVVEDACSKDEDKKEEKKDDKKEEAKEEKPAEKEDDKEKVAEDKCGKMAKDSEIVMDIDAIKKQVYDEAIADFKDRELARKAVRCIVGDVDVFAFDSAEDIYKFACEKAGVNCEGIANFKSAFCGLSAGRKKLSLDAAPISSGDSECFNGIRVE